MVSSCTVEWNASKDLWTVFTIYLCWTLPKAVLLYTHNDILNQTISKLNKLNNKKRLCKANTDIYIFVENSSYTSNCEDKLWKLLKLSKMYINALSLNHRPLTLTVTLPNLLYTAIAAKHAMTNTGWCRRWTKKSKAIQNQFVSVSHCEAWNERGWKNSKKKERNTEHMAHGDLVSFPFPHHPCFPSSHTPGTISPRGINTQLKLFN